MFKQRLPWSDYTDDQELGQEPDEPLEIESRNWKRYLQWSGIVTATLLLVPVLMILSMRWIAPRTSAYMLLYSPKQTTIHHRWVPWSAISPHMPIAVVAAEDQKFPHHFGFDFEAIGDALEENKRRKRPRGASTISQQVSKNLFLWSGGGYFRKGLEAVLTVLIEVLWPKKRILEVYLNIAEFGPGVYGVGAASQIYFHKPAAALLEPEAALLAAVLPNPRRLRVQYPSPYVQERAWEIQRQITGLGGPGYLNLN
jgi:monofunctional biosynthetic peptidoglycan transglycosylase